MVKATLRGAVLLGALVWSASSFAETQDIRISGETTVRAFQRNSLRVSEDVFNNSAAGSRAGLGQVDTATDAGDPAAVSDYGSASDSFVQQGLQFC